MNKHICSNLILIALVSIFFSSCRLYYPNRMFKTKHSTFVDSIHKQADDVEMDNIIRVNDYITLQVYTNGGEKLIDPNNEYNRNANASSTQKSPEPIKYLVRSDGHVDCPMVGDVYLNGYTTHQADSILSIHYELYYKGVFVKTQILNKRIIVFGPPVGLQGGGGKVLYLENKNITLIEAIALYGGIPNQGKSYNIKLIRGDLKDPIVQIIDLSTIEGMKTASLEVQPNDIIYIEPARPIISTSIKEISPLLSIIATFATLILLLKN